MGAAMGFLKRFLGSGPPGDTAPVDAPDRLDVEARPDVPSDPTSTDAEERAYELELLRGEQARLSELAQRQLRYAKYAWEPPPQGGERRADDADAKTDR
jgi:hypothetical protein